MSTEPKPKKARAPKTAAPAKPTSPEDLEGKFQQGVLKLLAEANEIHSKSAQAIGEIAAAIGLDTDLRLESLDKAGQDVHEENVRLFHRCQELENVIERLEAEKIELVASDPERAALFDALGSINPFVHVLARTNQIYPQLVTESDPDAIDRIPALPLAIQDYSTRINSPLPKRYELAIEAAARMMIYASDLFDQMKDAMPELVETPGPKVVQDEETTSPAVPEREVPEPVEWVEGQEGKTEGGAE